jgi:hypothetical protein
VLIKGTELKHIHTGYYSEDTEFEINKYNETTDSIDAVMDLLQDLPADTTVSSYLSSILAIDIAATTYCHM